MREMLRGALLSVLFLGLMTGGAPTMAAADDKVTLNEVLNVVGNYIPIPTLSVPLGAQPGVNMVGPGAGGLGPELGYLDESIRQGVQKAVKKALSAAAKTAGGTPEKVCGWYGEKRHSRMASAVRIGVAVLALAHIWLDLTENEIFGKPSLKNAELKKQLAGAMGLIAAGGQVDSIIEDFCNLVGHPV